MKNTRLAVFALAVMVGLAQGCSHSCTLVGWQEGLTVNVTSDQPLTGGSYRFVLELPDQTLDVDLTLEEPKNTQQGVIVSQRIDHNYWQVNASLTGSTQFGSHGNVVIGRLGGLLGGVGGPESLTLTVLQDGAQIGALKLAAIDYSQREVNGPGCGVATTATATIAIAPVQ